MSREGEGIDSAGANILGIWCGDSGTIDDKDKIGGNGRDKEDDGSCGEISADVLTTGEIGVDKFEVGGRDKNLLVNSVWEIVEGQSCCGGVAEYISLAGNICSSNVTYREYKLYWLKNQDINIL